MDRTPRQSFVSKVGAHNITAQQGGMTVDPADVYYTQVQRILYSHPPNYLSRNCALAMNPCQPSVQRAIGSQKSDATFVKFSLLTKTLS